MSKKPFLIAATLLAMALIAALSVDVSIAHAMNTDSVPGEVQALLNRAETFGHGYGVIFIILTIWILTRCEFRKLTPLIACSLGAGLMADVFKVIIGRSRPYTLPEDFAGSTFTGFMPWWGSESLHDTFAHANQSFPSAHTATAFGLAVCLAWLYPQGSRLFYTLAGLVAVQRMVAGAHYLSDVLSGAALGIMFATMAVHYFAQRAADSGEDVVPRVTPESQQTYRQAA